MNEMTRKEFLGSLVKGSAAVVGIAALASACGSSSSGSDATGASCTMNGTTDTIDGNHGHVLTVSKADVIAGADKTYDIMGSASHTHNVTVTAAMFAMLQANHGVSVTTTVTLSHMHSISIVCA